ncbi:MAG: hypothetical protein MOB07_09600 [Acidobacteria bacterium]|nr:hypothetical protein [Acidobacteriota bacterium]
MKKALIQQFRQPLKNCLSCGKEFRPKNKRRNYCSTDCRPSSQFKRPTLGMTTVKCGAHSELIACAYLLRKGYDVYRAVNWMSKADLVAVRASEIIRVQVRTGNYINAKGTFCYSEPMDDAYDLLMVVDHEGNIVVEKFRTIQRIA